MDLVPWLVVIIVIKDPVIPKILASGVILVKVYSGIKKDKYLTCLVSISVKKVHHLDKIYAHLKSRKQNQSIEMVGVYFN